MRYSTNSIKSNQVNGITMITKHQCGFKCEYQYRALSERGPTLDLRIWRLTSIAAMKKYNILSAVVNS